MKTFLLILRWVCLGGRCCGLWLGLLLLATAPVRAQAPANDEPLGAIVLPVGATCTPTAGTTFNATNTVANGYVRDNCGGSSGGYTGGQADVWYRFTTPATGAAASRAVRLTLTGAAAGLVRVFSTPAGSAGPFGEVRCASSGAANTAVGNVDVIGLQPGTNYYVLVGGYLRTDPLGPFTICVTDPTPCGDPQNVSISGISGTLAQLDFRPGNGNVSYTVVVTRQGATPVTLSPVPTTAPISLTGLVPNSAYTVTLQANCANGGTSSVFTQAFSTTSGNDEPQDAITLPLGTTTCVPRGGTTAGATPTLIAGDCSGGTNTRGDVWFKFAEPVSNSYVQIQVTGNAGSVRLYHNNNLNTPIVVGSLNLIGCSEVYRSGAPGQPGQTALPFITNVSYVGGLADRYYVAVGPGLPGETGGPFTICVTELANFPACRFPTSVGALATGPTTADVGFVSSTLGAPSTYTVTAIPQTAGSTVTATVAAGGPAQGAVATLTGLTPGTRYTASVVGRCSATSTTIPVYVSFTTLYLPPANDQCNGAIPIGCGQTLAGSLNGATGTNPLPGSCGGVPLALRGVYYSIVGTGNPIRLSLCSPNTQMADNNLLVLQGGCSNAVCIAGNTTDPACPTRNAGLTFASQAGLRYTIVVNNRLTGSFTGNFDLTATCAAPVCGAATGVAVSAVTASTARVDFVAPVGGAAPLNYTVALARSGGPAITATVVGSPVLFSGLLPNTAYTACVTTNCAGTSTSAPACGPGFSTLLASRNAALAGQLGLFPNPATQRTTLTVPAALLRQNALLSLIDGLGRTVQQRFVTPAPGRSTETRTELDLHSLPAGVYTLRLLSSEGPLTKRLVVE